MSLHRPLLGGASQATGQARSNPIRRKTQGYRAALARRRPSSDTLNSARTPSIGLCHSADRHDHRIPALSGCRSQGPHRRNWTVCAIFAWVSDDIEHGVDERPSAGLGRKKHPMPAPACVEICGASLEKSGELVLTACHFGMHTLGNLRPVSPWQCFTCVCVLCTHGEIYV